MSDLISIWRGFSSLRFLLLNSGPLPVPKDG